MGRFQCSRCGACCTSTLATAADGNLFGIYLDPSEIDRFPADAVFPLFGRGSPVVITAYQLGMDRCPNYEESSGAGRCRIYERRPMTCAAYPVIGRTRVSPECPAVKKITDGIDASSLASELQVHQKKLDLMLSAPANDWVWPLNKKCWVPLHTT